jgi:hypothetical protein
LILIKIADETAKSLNEAKRAGLTYLLEKSQMAGMA